MASIVQSFSATELTLGLVLGHFRNEFTASSRAIFAGALAAIVGITVSGVGVNFLSDLNAIRGGLVTAALVFLASHTLLRKRNV